MNQTRTLIWQAMGLGPVWQLRQTGGHHIDTENPVSMGEALNQGTSDIHFDETEAAKKADVLFIGDGFDQFDAALIHHHEVLYEKMPLLYQQIEQQLQRLGQCSAHLVHVRQFYDLLHSAQNNSAQNNSALQEEKLACLAHLKKQLDIVQPKVLIVLGQAIADLLLGMQEDQVQSEQRYLGIPMIVSENLQQVLTQPILKRKVWFDLCRAMDVLQQADTFVFTR